MTFKLKNKAAQLSQAHWLFAGVALVFGILFISLTPPLWGPDEGVHFSRSYQISKGELTQKTAIIQGKASSGGVLPKALVTLNTLKDKDIADNVSGQLGQVDSTKEYTYIGNTTLLKNTLALNPFGTLGYPVIAYIAPAVAMAMANLFHPSLLTLIYVARLATLMLFITITVMSLYMLRKSAVKWLMFVVALLPSTVYQASVVSVDPLITALCFVLFSSMYYLVHTEEPIKKKYIVLLSLAATLLAFLKPPYALFVFILPLLKLNQSTSRLTGLFIKYVIPILSILMVTVVMYFFRVNPSISPPGVNFSAQLHWIFHDIYGYIHMLLKSGLLIDWTPQVMGVFGSSFIFAPMPVVYFLISLLALSTYIRTSEHKQGVSSVSIAQAAVYLVISFGVIIAVITTLFLAFTPVGSSLVAGVQGRYFIPILMFLLYGARKLTKARFIVEERSVRIAYPVIMASCLLISILWYYRVLY